VQEQDYRRATSGARGRGHEDLVAVRLAGHLDAALEELTGLAEPIRRCARDQREQHDQARGETDDRVAQHAKVLLRKFGHGR
jgi:hypothetical protein